MRAVIQRVSHARVTIEGKVSGEIGRGFLILLGVCEGDTEAIGGLRGLRGLGGLRGLRGLGGLRGLRGLGGLVGFRKFSRV